MYDKSLFDIVGTTRLMRTRYVSPNHMLIMCPT